MGNVTLAGQRHRHAQRLRQAAIDRRIVGAQAPPVGKHDLGRSVAKVGAKGEQALEVAEAPAVLAAAEFPIGAADRELAGAAHASHISSTWAHSSPSMDLTG